MDFKGPDSDDNIDSAIDNLEDEFDSDEEKDEHEPMLEEDAADTMPVFRDMNSYIKSPFEDVSDDMME